MVLMTSSLMSNECEAFNVPIVIRISFLVKWQNLCPFLNWVMSLLLVLRKQCTISVDLYNDDHHPTL